MIKLGDLVKLNSHDYPQYKNMTGVVVGKSDHLPGRGLIMINGNIHEYYVRSESIEVLNDKEQHGI